MVKDAAKERKTRLEEKRNLVVEMRPEFAQAFQSCMNFSSKSEFANQYSNSGEWQSI
jgi:hypothetical protein